jgi:hypothetical protein
MFRTADQRRAFFAKTRQLERQHFPLRGERSRARANRTLALAAGVSVLAPVLTIATGVGKRTGPFRAMLGTSGYHHTIKDGMIADQPRPASRGSQFRTGSFLSGSRQATRSEQALLNLLRKSRRVRRLMGAESFKTRGGRIWTVSGVPLDAKLKAAFRPWRDRRVERASLWGLFGKGEFKNVIEQASLHGQDAARRGTRSLLTRMAERIERPVGRAMRRGVLGPTVRANRKVAQLARHAGRFLVGRIA